MFVRQDHKTLLTGSVLSRHERFEDDALCWERSDTMRLHRGGHFDWITHTSSEEAGRQAERLHEHLTGLWQVVGTGDGPFFLQLGTDSGDMFSFAIVRDSADAYLLNRKPWVFQKLGVLRIAA
jgi:hypothetical protein